jgi:hypothetical protein
MRPCLGVKGLQMLQLGLDQLTDVAPANWYDDRTVDVTLLLGETMNQRSIVVHRHSTHQVAVKYKTVGRSAVHCLVHCTASSQLSQLGRFRGQSKQF